MSMISSSLREAFPIPRAFVGTMCGRLLLGLFDILSKAFTRAICLRTETSESVFTAAEVAVVTAAR